MSTTTSRPLFSKKLNCDAIFDGHEHRIHAAELNANPFVIRSRIKSLAANRGIKTKTSVADDCVIVRAVSWQM